MAVAFAPSTAPRTDPLGRRAPAGRPALRVIEGDRSRAAMAATYRRRRLVAAVGLVLAAVALVLAVQAAAGVAAGWAAPSSAPIEGPVVTVEAQPGDTLWTLARRVQPSGDVRPAVEAMLAERGTAALEVGEEVRVPAGS